MAGAASDAGVAREADRVGVRLAPIISGAPVARRRSGGTEINTLPGSRWFSLSIPAWSHPSYLRQ